MGQALLTKGAKLQVRDNFIAKDSSNTASQRADDADWTDVFGMKGIVRSGGARAQVDVTAWNHDQRTFLSSIKEGETGTMTIIQMRDDPGQIILRDKFREAEGAALRILIPISPERVLNDLDDYYIDVMLCSIIDHKPDYGESTDSVIDTFEIQLIKPYDFAEVPVV